jgi:hypothetical protein
MLGAEVLEEEKRLARERQRKAGEVHGKGQLLESVPEAIGEGTARDRAGEAAGWEERRVRAG